MTNRSAITVAAKKRITLAIKGNLDVIVILSAVYFTNAAFVVFLIFISNYVAK